MICAKKRACEGPVVSIVVPTYNQAEYLPSCLDSIMNQSYPNIEVIIANDASTDNTREVFEDYMGGLGGKAEIVTDYIDNEVVREAMLRYSDSNVSIVYLENNKNLGVSGNYNRGFSEAKGRYVKFMPSDDMLLPNHVETLMKALEDGFDFAYSDFVLVDDMLRTELMYTLPEYDFKTCLARWYRLGPSHLFRKSLFEKNGGFSGEYKLANDYDLFLRFAMSGAKFVRVPAILYYKRSHKKRRVGQWSPDNYSLIIEESVRCAARARDWNRSTAPVNP